MSFNELIGEAASRLQVDDLVPLRPGGQKLVFSGVHRGKPVVMKVVPVMAPHEAQVLERARREVQLLASLDDDRIVGVESGLAALGANPEAPHGVAWLEELLDGQDLSELLGSPWEIAEVDGLLRGLAGALSLLHAKDVVHRDLSPGNIRRRSNGQWTLMDPGLAKHLTELSITGLYQPGTHGFRSPEHVPAGTPGTYSDVFCVGILAHIGLTGTYPVDPSGDESNYFDRLRELQVPSVRQSRSETPEWLGEIVDTCLDRQPARRYLDALELQDALDKAATAV